MSLVKPCSVTVGYQCFGGLSCLHLKGDGGGSTVLRKAGIPPRLYTVSQPRRQLVETSSP